MKEIFSKDISLYEINEFANSNEIYQEGRKIFEKENEDIKIIDININSENIWEFKTIDKLKVYQSEIYLNKNNKIEGTCTCPLKKNCKHLVASLFELQKNNCKLFYVQKSLEEINAGFDELKFDYIEENFSIDKILEALKLIPKLEDIKYHKNKIQAKLFLSKQFYLLELNYNSKNISGNCSLEYYFDKSFCVHQLALLIKYFKDKRKEEIPSNFENELRIKKANENFIYFDNFLSHLKNRNENKTNIKKNKKEVKFVFDFDGSSFQIKKALVLKNGELSPLQNTSEKFIQENSQFISKFGNKVFDFFISLNTNSYTYNKLEKNSFNSAMDLELLRLLKKYYLEDKYNFSNVSFLENKIMINLNFEKIDNNYLFFPCIYNSNQIIKLNKNNFSFFERSENWAKLKIDNEYLLFEIKNEKKDILKNIILLGEVLIPMEKIDEFLEKNYILLSNDLKINLPKEKEIKTIESDMKALLFLKNYSNYFSMELAFLYGEHKVFYDDAKEIIYLGENSTLNQIKRDSEKEKKSYLKLLEHDIVEKNGILLPAIEPINWLAEKASDLIEEGFEIYGEDKLINIRINRFEPKIKLNLSSNIDWFDLNIEIHFDKTKLDFKDLKNSILKGERFVKLSDGTNGIIPKKWIKKLSGVISFLEEKDEKILASKAQIKIVEEIIDIASEYNTDKIFEDMKKKFNSFQGIEEIKLPKELKGELRDYQKIGFYWLNFLREFGFGGVLADEMGLGKTLQVLSLLQNEKENNRLETCLIVVPVSLIFNWENEIRKFTPKLNFYIHHGLEREKDLASKILDKSKKLSENGEKIDLIITSYGTLRNDIEIFNKILFYYIILDESQQIKNPSTRIAKAVYSLKAKNKLVMTGTPIENNLVELWSQFSFLNPGFLGKLDFFKNNFLKKISEEKDKDKMLALKNMINPFLLMRKKKLVAKELPEKQISILYCEMNEKQRKFYEIWKNKIREEIKDAIEEGGFLNAKLKILQGLTRLRQICNHPKLVDESYMGSSSKIDLIFDQIQEIIEEGHKILIFSSFIGMLKIVKEKFDVLNIDYSYLDGQSKNRQDIVNEFIENEEKKVFLISIKAGGLGLNLTVADYVFIIDPWWNPAIEMQAIDRVHRIGQKKNVFVYKTIVKDSVEEKIIELQESKKELIENLISSEEGIFKNLNQKDIDKIFQ